MVGLNIIAVLGAVFLGPAIWLAATTLLLVTILAILGSFLAKGELRVEGGEVRSGPRGMAKALSVAKDAIADLRIVQVGHESSSATEIWMRSADGTERAIARRLPSGRAALYITALLRAELGLSG